jgi:hypothetical protein
MEKVRRILSIDGGGIKGVFPASFLSTVEDAIGDRIANYFDLIVGTSTGGIIALGLGLGLSADEILSFYEELGPQIFKGNPLYKALRHLIFSKYDDAPLRDALEQTLGSCTLGESKSRLVIPAMNLDTGEAYLYKTAHHAKNERDHKQLAVTVALATAAAPTYFPSHQSSSGLALVDGGLWANNPTGVAVIEAVANLAWAPQSLRILSLGCTTSPSSVGWERWLALGQLHWASRCVELFMSGQSSSALGIATLFAGQEHLLRISPSAAKGRFTMDGIRDISCLKGLGVSEARKALPKLRQMFLTTPVAPFQPYCFHKR